MMTRGSVRAITVCAAAILAGMPGFSQKGSPSNPPTGSGSAPSTKPTVPSQPGPPTTPMPQQPIFISGRVLAEDGKPPSEPAKIERVCLGTPHGEGYTDANGYFSIQLFADNQMFQDASESSSSAVRSISWGVMPATGSSTSSSSGFCISSMPISSHCFCPWDRILAVAERNWERPVISRTSSILAR